MRKPTNLWAWIAVLAAIWVLFILVHPAIELPDGATPGVQDGARIFQLHVVLLAMLPAGLLLAAWFGAESYGLVEMLTPCRPGKVSSMLPLLC